MAVNRSLVAQIQEVERELALRRKVYGRETNPRKQSENEEHLLRMDAVLATLQWVQRNEVKIREALSAAPGP